MNYLLALAIMFLVGCALASPPLNTKREKTENCLDGEGKDYSGKIARTAGGNECMKWISYCDYCDNEDFPENSIVDAMNYCRSPDSAPIPWCYASFESRNGPPFVVRANCDVPRCKGNVVKEFDVSSTMPFDLGKGQEYGNREFFFELVDDNPLLAKIQRYGTWETLPNGPEEFNLKTGKTASGFDVVGPVYSADTYLGKVWWRIEKIDTDLPYTITIQIIEK